MEATLTARDKKLLYMLGFIVIAFVFGWLLMRPVIKSIAKTDEAITSAQMLKQQNENKSMQLLSAKILMESFEEDLAEATEEYYEPMDSSEIDKMFTMYVLGFGLRAKDLIISMPTSALDETPYKYSEIGKRVQEREKSSSSASSDSDSSSLAADSSGSSSDGISADDMSLMVSFTQNPLDAYSEKKMMVKDTMSSGIRCAEVTIILTGSREKTQKFLDDILMKPSMRVTGFAWEDRPPILYTFEDGSVTVADSMDKQLTVYVNLYMYDSEKAGIETARKKD